MASWLGEDSNRGLPSYSPVRTLSGHSKPVEDLAFSPDGKWIASVSEAAAKVYGTETGEPRYELQSEEHPTNGNSAAFSPDGKTLAVGTESGIVFWDAVSGKAKGSHQARWAIRRLAYSPDGAVLAALHADLDGPEILLLNGATGTRTASIRLVRTVTLHLDVGFVDQMTIATLSQNEVALWNVASHAKKKSLELDRKDESSEFEALGVAPGAGLLAVTVFMSPHEPWQTRLLDPTSLAEKARLPLERGENMDVLGLSHDGRWLVTSHDMQALPTLLWDVTTGKRVAMLDAKRDGAKRAVFSKDGRWLAIANHDGTVRLWDMGQVR
jgi:WD40 repeat protein